jgi:hypothetical protein
MYETERQTALCYGHYDTLLLTRQRILEMLGLLVEVALTPAEFRQKLLDNDVSLILLCHSLSTEECLSAAALANEKRPTAKLITMQNRFGECHLRQNGFAFPIEDGPAALIRAVKQLLPIHQTSAAN